MKLEHLTPEGWKPCEANQRGCKYERRIAPDGAAAFVDAVAKDVVSGKPHAVKNFFNSLFGDKKETLDEEEANPSADFSAPETQVFDRMSKTAAVSATFKPMACSDCESETAGGYTITPRVMNPAKDETVFACPQCSKTLSKEEEQRLTDWEDFPCECGYRLELFDNEAVLLVRPESAALLNKDEVKQRTWFHTTSSPDWLTQLTAAGIYAHVGSHDAAVDRAMVKNRNKDSPQERTYLWEIKVKEEAVVTDDVMRDDSDWIERVTPHSTKHLGGDVQRYLNKFESAGSISLQIDPHLIECVKVTEITEQS